VKGGREGRPGHPGKLEKSAVAPSSLQPVTPRTEHTPCIEAGCGSESCVGQVGLCRAALGCGGSGSVPRSVAEGGARQRERRSKTLHLREWRAALTNSTHGGEFLGMFPTSRASRLSRNSVMSRKGREGVFSRRVRDTGVSSVPRLDTHRAATFCRAHVAEQSRCGTCLRNRTPGRRKQNRHCSIKFA